MLYLSGLPVAIDRAVLLPHEFRELASEGVGKAHALTVNYPTSEPTAPNSSENRV
jgi:hypothetical protein